MIGFIVLTTLVVLHELGHFLTAKKNGVKVNEFGIGFPPRAIAWIHIPASQVEEYLENLSEAGKKQLNQTKLQKKLTKIKNCASIIYFSFISKLYDGLSYNLRAF